MNNTSESRLQQECFTWHWNNFPEERGRLWMQYNNPKNAAHGSVLKGMGLLPGISDLAYLRSDGRMVFIELKLPGNQQSPAQIEWERTVRECGSYYCVINTLEQFKTAIKLAQCNPEHANTTNY